MQLRELIDLVDAESVWGAELFDGRVIDTCVAADLMSDVLAYSQPGALLVTGLASVQSAHTADIADLAAILYVAGKRPAQAVLDLAAEKAIPLLTTPLSMFDVCGLLHRAGMKAGVRR